MFVSECGVYKRGKSLNKGDLMSVTAYVQVGVENGMSYEAKEQMLRIAGVTRVKLISGEYDLFVIIRADDTTKLGKLFQTVAKSPHVMKTLISIVLE